MLDKNRMRQHHFEVTYVLGRFFSEHLDDARPCNAMSISQSTGIPRETVSRKARDLVARGWVRRKGPDELFVTQAPARHFTEFGLEALVQFHDAAREVLQLVERRARR